MSLISVTENALKKCQQKISYEWLALCGPSFSFSLYKSRKKVQLTENTFKKWPIR